MPRACAGCHSKRRCQRIVNFNIGITGRTTDRLKSIDICCSWSKPIIYRFRVRSGNRITRIETGPNRKLSATASFRSFKQKSELGVTIAISNPNLKVISRTCRQMYAKFRPEIITRNITGTCQRIIHINICVIRAKTKLMHACYARCVLIILMFRGICICYRHANAIRQRNCFFSGIAVGTLFYTNRFKITGTANHNIICVAGFHVVRKSCVAFGIGISSLFL